MRKNLIICLVVFAALIAMPLQAGAQQRRTLRPSSTSSNLDSARMKQLRQELKNTKDSSRRRELRKEMMQLQVKRFNSIRNLRSSGGRTNTNR